MVGFCGGVCMPTLVGLVALLIGCRNVTSVSVFVEFWLLSLLSLVSALIPCASGCALVWVWVRVYCLDLGCLV